MAAIPEPEMACGCCGARDWERRWEQFIVCRRCGVMTLPQNYDPAELKKLYQEDYFHGREYVDYLADKPAQRKMLEDHLRRLREFVPRGGRVLEIGCAYGFFLELLKEEYPGSVGVDVFSAGVAMARQQGLDAREGNLLELPIEGQFDAVCLWDTIEHLSQPYEMVKRAAELLKPGGHLFVTTGDFGASLARWQGRNWRQIHPPTHLFYFTRASLQALSERVGVEVMRFETVSVHRRFGSALLALEKTRAGSFAGKVAAMMIKGSPRWLLDWCFPLNLGDTVRMVARKKTSNQ